MRQSNTKTPIVFRVALVLFCAMLISFSMMGGLYARYVTTISGSDSARVAKFVFTDNLDTQMQTFVTESASMFPGKTVQVTAGISNQGEVSIRCIVTVENLTDNLPISDATLASIDLVPGQSADFDIPFTWPADRNSIEYSGKMDIFRISVVVEQID